MTETIYQVDRRVDGPWLPSYLLSVRCGNCGELHVAELSRGQEPDRRGEACPYCEISGKLMYGNSVEAAAFLADKPAYCVSEMENRKFMPTLGRPSCSSTIQGPENLAALETPLD